jgi:hypothetical protein
MDKIDTGLVSCDDNEIEQMPDEMGQAEDSKKTENRQPCHETSFGYA